MQHLQHAGAHEAAEDRDLEDRQRGHREHHVDEEVHGVVDATGMHAEEGEAPVERRLFQEDRKNQQEINAQHEAGNRDADIGNDGRRHVSLGVLVSRCVDPQRDTDRQRHQQGRAQQQDGVR